MLGVPRSSFYAWRNQAETVTAARRLDLAARIERIFTDSRSTYDCRRITAELNRDGRPAGVGLVADLMRELGLRACQPRAYHRVGTARTMEQWQPTLDVLAIRGTITDLLMAEMAGLGYDTDARSRRA